MGLGKQRSTKHLHRRLPVACALLALTVHDADAARNIFTSPQELQSLPTSGPSWEKLLDYANRAANVSFSNPDENDDTYVLAKGLVYARTGEERYRTEAVQAIMSSMGTEGSGVSPYLSLGRSLPGIIIAADLVGMPADDDARFKSWLRTVRSANLGGRTLISAHEDRPNNHGTHPGAARMLLARYIDDEADLRRCADVYRGWIGEREYYDSFQYVRGLAWQSDPDRPVGINPVGATIRGYNVDGVLPEEQRRTGGFSWPPKYENYVWEGLQGPILTSIVLYRAGYTDVWEWGDSGLLRAFRWLYEVAGYGPQGDDTWMPHVMDHVFGTHFDGPVPSTPGKNVGFTDWLYGPGSQPFFGGDLEVPAAPVLLAQ